MARRSKRYKKAAESIDSDKLYTLEDAIAVIEKFPKATLDESVDLAINLAVDPKHADQMVRGAIVLPHGIGKAVRVLVFAKGDKEQEARDAGADFVGGDDLAKKIQDEGWMEFDRVIASPDMMGVVGRLGKVLGPRGLMPNPKLGTVTPNVGQAVGEQKAGKVEFRVDKAGIIHCSIGKRSLGAQAILENASELISTVQRARPATTKGIYMKKITVSTTMGPGLKVDPQAPLAVKAA
ncbi:MAG TPA: 50S ribosomal protein L1 [Myxococcales bacterium]|nr:50S ribosomal protein L1 [Myxococcales bacterium]HIL81445.1 50S ribosomal protein L1 [Myxococcales bacterium]